MVSGARNLTELADEARSRDEGSFVATLSTLVLVGSDADEEDCGWQFATRYESVVSLASEDPTRFTKVGTRPNPRPVPNLRRGFVWPIAKRAKGESFQNVVMLGRSPSNDIVLTHPSVSKLHARLLLEGSVTKLRDADSSNGTWLNDAKLSGEDLPLSDGDIVRLGDVHLFVFTGARLFSALRTLLPDLSDL